MPPSFLLKNKSNGTRIMRDTRSIKNAFGNQTGVVIIKKRTAEEIRVLIFRCLIKLAAPEVSRA